MLVPDSLVTNICAHKLMSAIYYIAWSFFSLQLAKTCNSQKYRLTEKAVCAWVMSKHSYWYISVTFVLSHHVRKGIRLSPSLLFVVVVLGESLETRLAKQQFLSDGACYWPECAQGVWSDMLTWFAPASTPQPSHNLLWLHVQFDGAWQHILHSSWIDKWRFWAVRITHDAKTRGWKKNLFKGFLEGQIQSVLF